MQDKIDEFLNEPLAQKFLFFNEMLTPSLIRIAYWLTLVAIAWTGLGHMFSGGFGNFLEGIVRIAMGAVLARIAAELIMVLFRINDSMAEVAKNTASAAVNEPAKKVVRKKATKKVGKKVSKKT